MYPAPETALSRFEKTWVNFSRVFTIVVLGVGRYEAVVAEHEGFEFAAEGPY
jgi:hypothetical protein